MSYLALKHLHLTFVLLTLLSFSARGVGMLINAPWLERKWVRITPHVIDTGLLASAIALAISVQQYPFMHDWLTAKLLGLMAYIILGTVALRRGKTRQVRIIALILALMAFAYIVTVAITKNPLPGI